ncbi:hypothetical protein Ac2012v2_007205 [Leucoagaricus gongylophorus]
MLPSTLRWASRTVKNARIKSEPVPTGSEDSLSSAAKQVRKNLEKTIKQNQKDISKFQRFLDQGLPNERVNDSALKGRTNLLWRIRKLINDRYDSSYQVDTFGSSKYGAASVKSDMDLIILDRSRPSGFHPGDTTKTPKIYHMGKLAAVLRKGGFLKVKVIPATVPIVKFEDPKTKIKCDINVNEQTGYWNSMMIKQYAEQSPHLIPLLKAIKLWAKPLGLNAPSPEIPKAPVTFSSYAYALMTIAFMQRRCLLPNLQDNVDEISPRPFWNRKPAWLCDLRFHSNLPSLPRNDEVAPSDLIGDWFRFWGDFDPAQQVVDIRLGGILSRTSEPLKSEPVPTDLQARLQSKMEAYHILQELGIPAEFMDSEEYEDWDMDEYDAPSNPDENSLEPSSVPGGKPYDPEALQRWESNTFCLIDPFIHIRNVAKNISSGVFEHFQAECRRAGAELGRR